MPICSKLCLKAVVTITIIIITKLNIYITLIAQYNVKIHVTYKNEKNVTKICKKCRYNLEKLIYEKERLLNRNVFNWN